MSCVTFVNKANLGSCFDIDRLEKLDESRGQQEGFWRWQMMDEFKIDFEWVLYLHGTSHDLGDHLPQSNLCSDGSVWRVPLVSVLPFVFHSSVLMSWSGLSAWLEGSSCSWWDRNWWVWVKGLYGMRSYPNIRTTVFGITRHQKDHLFLKTPFLHQKKKITSSFFITFFKSLSPKLVCSQPALFLSFHQSPLSLFFFFFNTCPYSLKSSKGIKVTWDGARWSTYTLNTSSSLPLIKVSKYRNPLGSVQ